MFSRHVKQVTMIVRSDSLGAKMSQYLVDQIGSTPNIEVLTGTAGDRGRRVPPRRTHRSPRPGDREEVERPAQAIFIFVGAVPHSACVTDLVAVDDHGFILTGDDIFVDGKRPPTWTVERSPHLMETSIPGIFAAGDVRAGVVRRVASAVGQGSIAISMVHKYLEGV